MKKYQWDPKQSPTKVSGMRQIINNNFKKNVN